MALKASTAFWDKLVQGVNIDRIRAGDLTSVADLRDKAKTNAIHSRH